MTKNEINLWNLADGKTREVRLYIESLYPDALGDFNHVLFQKKINQALSATTPNLALEIIGYRIKNYPEIYDWCQ